MKPSPPEIPHPLRIVRPATLADAPNLSALAQRVFAETYSSNLPAQVLQEYLEQELSPEVFAQEISEQKAVFWVAQDLAGFIKLLPTNTPRNTVELVKLYVDSSQQGNGVGGALLRAGLEWAKAQGFAAVWLVVWQDNPKAVQFYQKHGFEIVGGQIVWVGEVAFQDHLMRRSLND